MLKSWTHLFRTREPEITPQIVTKALEKGLANYKELVDLTKEERQYLMECAADAEQKMNISVRWLYDELSKVRLQ